MELITREKIISTFIRQCDLINKNPFIEMSIHEIAYDISVMEVKTGIGIIRITRYPTQLEYFAWAGMEDKTPETQIFILTKEELESMLRHFEGL
jgi:hypothetical protein